jgi:hypothetical protein
MSEIDPLSVFPIDYVEGSGVWSTNVKSGFKRMVRERIELICDELEQEASLRLFRRDI